MQTLSALVKRACAAFSLSLLLAGPASAQFKPTLPMNGEKEIPPEEIEKRKANEAAAKAASSKIVAPKGTTDPWAGVRGADPAPAPAKKGAAK